MAIDKKKTSIKKIIKAQLELNKTQTKPVLNKPKPNIVEKQKALQEIKNQSVDYEYRQTDTPKPYNKQNRAFLSGNVEGGISANKQNLMTQFRNECVARKSSGYVKKNVVDCDVVICISSFDRYDKLLPLLTQIYAQASNYSFKVVLLDDASPDPNYRQLETIFPELIYCRNEKNNGRKFYWYTMTQMWQKAKDFNSSAILMMDDDFILCENFLNVLTDFFFMVKEDNNNVVAIAPHLHSYALQVEYMPWWYNTFSIDGIGMFDRDFIESFDFRLKPVTEEQLQAEGHAHGWSQIQKKIREEGKIAYKTRISIAFHDGNDESKLGAGTKKKSKAYTYYYKGSDVNVNDLIV